MTAMETYLQRVDTLIGSGIQVEHQVHFGKRIFAATTVKEGLKGI
jgi:hypothetical protein